MGLKGGEIMKRDDNFNEFCKIPFFNPNQYNLEDLVRIERVPNSNNKISLRVMRLYFGNGDEVDVRVSTTFCSDGLEILLNSIIGDKDARMATNKGWKKTVDLADSETVFNVKTLEAFIDGYSKGSKDTLNTAKLHINT